MIRPLWDDNMLSENDLKVLKAISEGDSDPQSIAKKLDMKVEAVRASADALERAGTRQGDQIRRGDLHPDRRRHKVCKRGPSREKTAAAIGSGKPMSELKDPAAKIGLGWLRKKGWATIQAGEIKPTGDRASGKGRRDSGDPVGRAKEQQRSG